MRLLPDPEQLVDSAATAWDLYLGPGVADLRPTPSSIVHEGPQCTVRRFRSPRRRRSDRAPVLLIPPLAAPASCFDLQRGCSLAEHLTSLGYLTYVIDYGPISFADRALGLEHWVEDVLPTAIGIVHRDSGDQPVQLVGWSLGGIMTLLTVASDQRLPVASAAVIASPFDFTRVRLAAPLRQIGRLTGGALESALYRALGGAPAPLVSRVFQLTSIDRYLTKPVWVLRNLPDREAIAHSQAIDRYMANMLAYPGRTFGQLYHRFFRVNDLADGVVDLGDHQIELANVRQPVLVIASEDDVLAPAAAVEAVVDLLPNAASVTYRLVTGSHLGALTGRGAEATTWRHLDEFLAAASRTEFRRAPQGSPTPRSRHRASRGRADVAATSSSRP
ncbi:MAG TPA: alpha/beta fold hydrolase [Thermoleophilaceae bacterium]|nr:alpha/beta fold hydrolase [Thermoleophilaceae bacterium]